jgi:hypothetical protein
MGREPGKPIAPMLARSMPADRGFAMARSTPVKILDFVISKC